MITITKLYKDYPAGHRQPTHDGHCRYVHGHNYDFEFTFAADRLDKDGFVADFGKLQFLKEFLTLNFDHKLCIASDDPELPFFEEMNLKGLCDLNVMPGTSAEAMAAFIFDYAGALIREKLGPRVWLQQVRVFEDSKNLATYSRS